MHAVPRFALGSTSSFELQASCSVLISSIAVAIKTVLRKLKVNIFPFHREEVMSVFLKYHFYCVSSDIRKTPHLLREGTDIVLKERFSGLHKKICITVARQRRNLADFPV